MGRYLVRRDHTWLSDETAELLARTEFSENWSDIELSTLIGVDIALIQKRRLSGVYEAADLLTSCYSELRDEVLVGANVTQMGDLLSVEFDDEESGLSMYEDLSRIRQLPADLDPRMEIRTPGANASDGEERSVYFTANPNFDEIMRFAAENHPDREVRLSVIRDGSLTLDPIHLSLLSTNADDHSISKAVSDRILNMALGGSEDFDFEDLW